MTRHSKNATANAVYTFYEKKADSEKGAYGTQRLRIGKDSLQEFNCCCLTLHPCIDPVITLDGYLYEREAIIEYLLHKKLEYKRKLKEYKRQKKLREQNEVNDNKRRRLDDGVISNMEGENAKHLPSFWVPSLTPAADDFLTPPKEEEEVCCPMTGKPLSHKDLITVKFTLAKGVNEKCTSSLLKAAREGLYICAVSGDALSSSASMAVLKPSGHVVKMSVINRLLEKDNTCPISGVKLTKDDIIPLKRVGTGFIAGGGDLKAERHNPSMD